MRTVVAPFLLIIQANTGAGFALLNQHQANKSPTSTICYANIDHKYADLQSSSAPPMTTRRTAISNSAKLLTTLLTTTTLTKTTHVGAIVTVDPDRYGDKELKMATVNIVKGKVRDLLTANPQLASPFLQLSMHDALTYDASTGEGGPDGSIVPLTLGSSPPKALVQLIPAARELDGLRKTLKRTTEITMADVVALAGAEAIETAGGPRLVVQLGKGEPRSSVAKEMGGLGTYPDLSGKGERVDVIRAFRRAGLTERDVALFYGVKVAVEKVVDDIVTVEEDVQEVNEMGEKDVSFPSSFGGAKEKYGKQIGQLDKAIFASILTGVKKKDSKTPDVFNDATVAECAQTYAKKKADYLKDLRQAYGSWMTLGAEYTGGGILLFDSNY